MRNHFQGPIACLEASWPRESPGLPRQNGQNVPLALLGPHVSSNGSVGRDCHIAETQALVHRAFVRLCVRSLMMMILLGPAQVARARVTGRSRSVADSLSRVRL